MCDTYVNFTEEFSYIFTDKLKGGLSWTDSGKKYYRPISRFISNDSVHC